MRAISNGYRVSERRSCTARTQRGDACRQAPLQESDLCFWHDPDRAHEAAEARRLGGLRSRREHTLAGACEYSGLDGVASIRRLVEIAVLDTLGLDNSIARARAIIAVAQAAARLVKVGELEERVALLEAAVRSRPDVPAPVFDLDAHDPARSQAVNAPHRRTSGDCS